MAKKKNSVYQQTPINKTKKRKKKLPDQAKGNPVYEQTSESQPLWCCGILFGRHSRLAVFVLSIVGIACSIWLRLSHDYFKFTSIRNDTFYDADKQQPEPFEYATVAKVGLFKYQIEEVFQYPTRLPTTTRERVLFRDMLDQEMERLQERKLQQTTTSISLQPSEMPSSAPSDTVQPSTSPSSAPTITNLNDYIAETVPLGVVLEYPKGMDQFDSVFYNAQLGSLLGPIFCGLAFLTGLAEYCFCYFQCSWLPTAIFLSLAFFFQTWTLFLFISDDFCKYAQECRLGVVGYFNVIGVLCYFLCSIVICCMPRPTPLFNVRPPPTTQRIKKKKGRSRDLEEPEDMN